MHFYVYTQLWLASQFADVGLLTTNTYIFKESHGENNQKSLGQTC